MARPARVLVLAGEASGDEHAAGLARALARRRPGIVLIGTGGPEMAAAGVELRAGLADLAVMGFTEVLPRLAYFRRLKRELTGMLDGGAIDLLVLVDFAGFNLRMLGAARRAGVPVLYYVPPKVWAWRPGRATAVAERAARVAVVLPFEVDVWRRAGASVTYVGHPLLDGGPSERHRDRYCARWDLDPDRPLLAVLPGSRRQEIDRHLETFLDAARRVRQEMPDVQPVVSRAGSLAPELFSGVDLPVVGDGRTLLHHATAALVKSGTASLEAVLEDVPCVVAYRTGSVSWALARRLIRVDHIALPNLVAGARIVPELVQREVKARRLAALLVTLLDVDAPERTKQLDAFRDVRERLGGPGAGERVADLAEELLDR